MIDKINILFLGGAKRVSLARRFIFSGRELNVDVEVFSYELIKDVPFREIGKVIIGKKWTEKTILDHLYKVIKTYEVKIILANVDMATLVLSKLKDRFPSLNVITSDLSVSRIFLDKYIMYKECLSKNIKTIPLANHQYPKFAKLRNGSASLGVKRLNNSKDEEIFFQSKNKSEYIIQKFIEGVEYTVDAYVDQNKRYIGAIPRIRMDIFGGESIKTKVIFDDEIILFSKKILEKFDLIGPITLQFIKRDNELYFLELNPRFGGGVIASIEAGFNIPKIMMKDYLKLKIKKLKNYNSLIMTRYFKEVFHAVDN